MGNQQQVNPGTGLQINPEMAEDAKELQEEQQELLNDIYSNNSRQKQIRRDFRSCSDNKTTFYNKCNSYKTPGFSILTVSRHHRPPTLIPVQMRNHKLFPWQRPTSVTIVTITELR